MNTASLSEIKRELRERSHDELIDHCLRLAKYKRENKELLNYLLFEAHDEGGYVAEIKSDIAEMFDEVNLSSVYFAKKTIRKILRFAAKHIKYSGSKQTEVEILIAFCLGMRKLDLPYHESKVLINLYDRQFHNIRKAMSQLNEDLQFDYQADFDLVSQPIVKARFY